MNTQPRLEIPLGNDIDLVVMRRDGDLRNCYADLRHKRDTSLAFTMFDINRARVVPALPVCPKPFDVWLGTTSFQMTVEDAERIAKFLGVAMPSEAEKAAMQS